MADYNSGLPIRTENAGDVKSIQVDATVPSQGASIDANGAGKQRITDAAGNLVTSGAQGTQRAMDVEINFGSAIIDPRATRALTSADVVTANQGTAGTSANGWPVKVTDGTNTVAVAPASTAATAIQAAQVVALSPNSPIPTGTNSIGTVKAQLQDNTGAAITLGQKVSTASVPVVLASDQGAISVKNQDGAGNLLTSQVNGTQRPLDVGINVAGVQIDPRSIRALTATDVVSANLRDATGTAFSATNPMPVSFSVDNAGTEINNYLVSTAVAAAASSNHDYTVTAGKTLLLTQVEASGSGKMKIEVQIESGVATAVFTTRFVQFNSTANTNSSLNIKAPITVAAGVRVRVIRTNRDNAAQDLYSTIAGQEV